MSAPDTHTATTLHHVTSRIRHVGWNANWDFISFVLRDAFSGDEPLSLKKYDTFAHFRQYRNRKHVQYYTFNYDSQTRVIHSIKQSTAPSSTCVLL